MDAKWFIVTFIDSLVCDDYKITKQQPNRILQIAQFYILITASKSMTYTAFTILQANFY